MNLIKTSFLTGIATFIRIATNFVIGKVVAVYIGPSGLALIGQFQNFTQITQSVANGATAQGVVKYTAEYKDDVKEKRKVLSTALMVCICASIIVGSGLFLFRQSLSKYLLKDDQFSIIFVIFAFTIIFFSLNTFLISVVNGERDIRKYTIVNICSSLFGSALTCWLSIQYHLFGALISLVLYQSLTFFVTLPLIIRSKWFIFKNFMGGLDKKILYCLSKYSFMAMVTALVTPISQIIIRNYVGDTISWDGAGYWQAIMRISNVYLLFITTTLSVYYLPRLSEIKDIPTLRKEIWHGYKMILPIVALFAFGIYLFRQDIVHILFAKSFIPMMPLFKYQLIGDVIKIGSWLLAYVMLAKTMTKMFVFSEITFGATLVLLSIFFVKYFGLKGATIAFAVNYVLYWIFVGFVYKVYCGKYKE